MANNISLQQAIDMTTRFRAECETVLTEDYQGKDILPRCETFGREAFDKLLEHPDCTGIRVYYGMNESLQLRSIIVAVNENNEDIIPEMDPEEENDGIVEDGGQCPPLCPPSSDLNP